MKGITDIEAQTKHIKKSAFELNSKVETEYFKEYILKTYKTHWHTLSDGVLYPEKQYWINKRKTGNYNFKLLID